MFIKTLVLVLIGLFLTLPALAKTTQEIDCLSKVIYHEARGESLEGKRAVGFVVLNRTKHENWPDDVCAVTLQPRQFSHFSLNIPIEYTSEAWKTSLQTAKNVYANKVTDPTNGALFFFNPHKVRPEWRNKMTFLKDIGNHRFLKLKETNDRRN